MANITIGIAGPLSGRAGKLGVEMQHAIELAIKEKNEEGGIAGVQIKAVVVDDASSVNKAKEVAQKLCREPDIMGVIGHYGSDTSLAAGKIYHEHGLPLLAPVASNPMLTESGLLNIFRYTNRDDRTAQAISGYLYKELHKHNAVVIKTNTAYGNSMSGQFEKAFAGEGGNILGTFTVDEGDQDFSQLPTALPGAADLFFYGGTFEGAYLLKALRAAGHRQLMATGDGCWDKVNFLDIAGETAEIGEGVLVLSASCAIGEVPGSTEFAKKYEREYGPVVNYALNAYDTARILIAAIENAAVSGGLDSATVMQSIRNIRFRGIANPRPVVWTKEGDNSASITNLNTVSNGRFTPVHLFAEQTSSSI